MLELKLIALYLYICEVYDSELQYHCQRFSPNGHRDYFTDEELLTVYLFAIMEEQKVKLKDIWRYTHKYWSDWFPALPSYQAFVSRLNRLANIFPILLQRVMEELEPAHSIQPNFSLIDSFPIITCSHKRAGKIGVPLVNKGYCATKGMHYYGLKLHFLGFWQPGALPFPEHIEITPASEHDLTAMRPHLETMHNRRIFGDKIYSDKALNQQLQQKQNAIIYTPIKLIRGRSEWERHWNAAADKRFSTAVSSVRQSVEAIFNWFIEKVDLQKASKVRSVKGVLVHVFGRLTAAFAFLVFNP